VETFLNVSGRSFVFHSLPAPEAFESPFGGKPYYLLLWEGRGGWLREEYFALGGSIIATNCRFAVCGGEQCSDWDDAIDYAAVFARIDGGIELPIVMTSWHERESVEEVVEFFLHSTRSADRDFNLFLVLTIAAGEEVAAALKSAITAATQEASFKAPAPRPLQSPED